jgi:NCS1 family nucleobase:cation symporter-1
MGMAFLTWFLDAEAFDISMYQVASSAVTKGLRPGLAIVTVVVAHLVWSCHAEWLCRMYICYQFPSIDKISICGIGTYFVVFIRGVVACVWRCPPMFHNPTANS